MTNVIAEVAAERVRQIEVEGWTPEFDDGHRSGELARASVTYALPHDWKAHDDSFWPFINPPKFKDRRRDLIRAAALLIAEIERLDRMEASE